MDAVGLVSEIRRIPGRCRVFFHPGFGWNYSANVLVNVANCGSSSAVAATTVNVTAPIRVARPRAASSGGRRAVGINSPSLDVITTTTAKALKAGEP